MTTYTLFQPSPAAPFTFQPTLDGTQYNITVTWSLFGQRYYVNCYTLTGALVFSLPLIGSPPGITIEAATWSLNTVTITTATPHGLPVGAIANLTINGMTPSAYNGNYQCLVVNPTQVTYALSSDPGVATSVGTLYYNINLAGGYFTTSTLIYRAQNQQFEVTP